MKMLKTRKIRHLPVYLDAKDEQNDFKSEKNTERRIFISRTGEIKLFTARF